MRNLAEAVQELYAKEQIDLGEAREFLFLIGMAKRDWTSKHTKQFGQRLRDDLAKIELDEISLAF